MTPTSWAQVTRNKNACNWRPVWGWSRWIFTTIVGIKTKFSSNYASFVAWCYFRPFWYKCRTSTCVVHEGREKERKIPDLLDLNLFAPSGAYTTDYSSPFSSVLCCQLHLPPSVSETCCPHFFLQISFPGVPRSSSWSAALWCPL